MLPYRGGERIGSGRGPCSQGQGYNPPRGATCQLPPPINTPTGGEHLSRGPTSPPSGTAHRGRRWIVELILRRTIYRRRQEVVDAVAKSAVAAKPAAKPAAKVAAAKPRSEARCRCKAHSEVFCRCGARGEDCRRCEASGEACREGGCFKVRGEAYCGCEAADSRPVAKLAAFMKLVANPAAKAAAEKKLRRQVPLIVLKDERLK